MTISQGRGLQGRAVRAFEHSQGEKLQRTQGPGNQPGKKNGRKMKRPGNNSK